MVEGEKEKTSGGEGDHELRESRQERSKIRILIPPPPTSRTITNCVKRVPPIASSSPPLLKKTRYNPDLTLCHGCGLRFPSVNNNDLSRTRLRLLRSCWRVVLLCKSCLSRIKSAEICSYCFQPVCESTVDCLDCFRRVHLDCARLEQRCFISRPFDPTKFTCIDCCVIPGPGGGRVSPKCVSSVSLVARNATLSVRKRGKVATKDKDDATAQHKAATLEHESKCARSPLGLSLGLKKEAPRSADDDAVVSDEQLALQLHLAINGSRRISRRSSCSVSSGASSVKLNKGDGLGGLEKVGVCTKDNSFLERVDRDGFVLALPAERCANRKGRKKATHKKNKDGSLVVIPKQDQGSCSDKMSLNSNGDDCNSSLTFVSHHGSLVVIPKQDQGSCSDKMSLNSNGDDCNSSLTFVSHQICKNKEAGVEPSELLECTNNVPDRCLEKYNKRSKKLSGLSKSKGNELFQEDNMSCSEASRTLTDVSDQVPVAEF